MDDDLIILASAYLDGEATPDERARVEADPELLDEVERLRTARATMIDARWFERPRDDAREAAITAALAACDMPATEVAVATAAVGPAHRPRVVAFERRRAYTRWLSAAAAVVAVLGLGVIVTQLDGGDDNDDSTAFEAPAGTMASAEANTERAEPPAATSEALASDADTADATNAAGGADGATAATAPAELAAAPDATEAPAAEAPADVATAYGSEFESLPEANLENTQELGTFAADSKQSADEGSTSAPQLCSDNGPELESIDEYVATGTYRGRTVVIGIDAERGRAIAVDPETCAIVAEAPLP